MSLYKSKFIPESIIVPKLIQETEFLNDPSISNNAKKIIIDIDQNELEKKTLFPDYKINCSADVFIDSMIKYNVKLIICLNLDKANPKYLTPI